MNNLYILGAGGCGRETLLMLRQMEAIQGQCWNVKGFLDDTKTDFGGIDCELPIVGTIHDFYPAPNDRLALAVAAPEGKRQIVELLSTRGAIFETLIHPWASIGLHNKIGQGSVIYGGFSMTVNVCVGQFCTLLSCTLGHDVRVGDFSTISSFTHVMGNAKIGSGVFIGGNAAIAPHVLIHDNAYVCIGGVVLKNVPANAKVIGNPAREVG